MKQGYTKTLSELFKFLIERKRWWLIPIIVILLLSAIIIILGQTAAAPFIYTIF
jgi:hypothetical protein